MCLPTGVSYLRAAIDSWSWTMTQIFPKLKNDYLHAMYMYQSNRDINTPKGISLADMPEGMESRLCCCYLGWGFDRGSCGRGGVRI